LLAFAQDRGHCASPHALDSRYFSRFASLSASRADISSSSLLISSNYLEVLEKRDRQKPEGSPDKSDLYGPGWTTGVHVRLLSTDP
jgi:hypothetical protein